MKLTLDKLGLKVENFNIELLESSSVSQYGNINKHYKVKINNEMIDYMESMTISNVFKVNLQYIEDEIKKSAIEYYINQKYEIYSLIVKPFMIYN